MSDPTPDQTALATAQGLTSMLGSVRAELEKINDRQDRAEKLARRFRHIVATLAVSLVLDLALTVVVAVFAVQAHDASQTAESAASSNLALCRASNVSRAQTIGVWTHLLTDLGPPKTTAARVFETDFVAYLHSVYAPRNCARLGQRP